MNSKKNIKFITIDTFEGSEEVCHKNDLDIVNHSLYETFLKNIESVKDYVEVLKSNSKFLYQNFKDKSIDFLFLDASHEYVDVLNDIQLWYPKVKGIFAGHDFTWPGVRMAVEQSLPSFNL